MDDAASTAPAPAAPRAAAPARARTYAPDAETRARLSFADGPRVDEPSPGRPPGGGAVSSRTALVAVVAVAALVVLTTMVLFTVSNRAEDGALPAVVDRGPFDSAEAFVAALPVPPSFTRLGPDDASPYADADFVVDGSFETACANLGAAMRAMDPTYPELTPKDYQGGGVNRCEAEAPMAALHGATVRALVLKANNGAQIHVDDATLPTTAPTTAVVPGAPG